MRMDQDWSESVPGETIMVAPVEPNLWEMHESNRVHPIRAAGRASA